ncbi:MAG: serine hydrolase domain-containing protein [Cyclobacteriaceae bacterium]
MSRFFSAFILCLSFHVIQAQETDISTQLTKEIDQIATQGHINGFGVAIVNPDGLLYARGFGFADMKTKEHYSINTIQNIGSVSKTFIGVALLKAQELGHLQLDDPINQYLPFQVINPYHPEEAITIRQLATHTSSIKDPLRYETSGYILKEYSPTGKKKANFRSPDHMISLAKFQQSLLDPKGKWYKKSNFLKKKPGEWFDYTNVGAGLAAYVLELATQIPFDEFTQQHILDPLKMSTSGWNFESVDLSLHTQLYNDPKTELAPYSLVNYPDGGMITSVTDLSKYLTELIRGYNGQGKILSAAGFKELFTQQLTAAQFGERKESAFNDEYNSGIFMGFSAKGYVGHTGSDPGVATFMFFNSKTSIGKILFINTELKKEGVQEFIAIWQKMGEYEEQLSK